MLTDLSQRALLANLHLSAWTGQRMDSKATATVVQTHKTAKDAGRFAKSLLPKDALVGVINAHAKARMVFKTLTLPWLDSSCRIFPSQRLYDVREAMRKVLGEVDKAHAEFVAKYPTYLAAAPQHQGGLYNPSNYPTPDAVAAMFSHSFTITPVPSGDFRIGSLSDAERAELESEFAEAAKQQVGEAQKELWERLKEVLEKFVETLGDPNRTFQASTISKVVDLAKIAPSMALVADADLDDVCAKLTATINPQHADLYRTDALARKASVTAAQKALDEITNRMKGVFA
jgi:hypothetical protein